MFPEVIEMCLQGAHTETTPCSLSTAFQPALELWESLPLIPEQMCVHFGHDDFFSVFVQLRFFDSQLLDVDEYSVLTSYYLAEADLISDFLIFVFFDEIHMVCAVYSRQIKWLVDFHLILTTLVKILISIIEIAKLHLGTKKLNILPFQGKC